MIMEKKEAMKILKDFHDKSALFSVRTALDTIIPELRTSEDEKIRKALIEHFRWNTKQILNEFSNKKALAWLEKQKPDEWSEEDERIINSIIHDIRTSQHYDTHSIGEYDKKVFWLKSLKDKYLPQQKQEWSEEDKGTLERIISFINSFVDKDLGEVVLNEEIFTDDAQQELKRYVDFLRNIENIKN